MQGEYNGGCMGPRGARLWLFVGFVLGFAAVIASCWIFFTNFIGNGEPIIFLNVILKYFDKLYSELIHSLYS